MSDSLTAHEVSSPQAVIHDIRYSRFDGELRPRIYAVLAMARSSALRALGIRRSAGAKIWPFLLIASAFAPALVAVGVPLLLDQVGINSPLDVLEYSNMLQAISPILIAFVATTIPNLLTRERRDGVLSLYFSTAVSPMEYVIGKILAAVALISLVTLGPLLLMVLGGVVVADSPLTYAKDHADDWPRALAAGLVFCLFHAAIGLALGSLTSRRVFAVGGYVALMLVPAALFVVLFAISSARGFLAFILVTVPQELGRVIFDDQPDIDVTQVAPTGLLWGVWVAVVVIGLGAMVFRYRKGSAA